IVDGIDVQTWLTGKVSDVVDESLLTEAVGQIPIFNRIRELDKRDMMAVYECLEKNN
ncbi:ABC transporter, partial [Bacillus thuringiensis]|nr:ABC transporter [Bacillus thuringiensis]